MESELFQALKVYKTEPLILQNLNKCGKKITCEWTNVEFVDSENFLVGTLFIAKDITDKTRLESLINQTQKMDAIVNLPGESPMILIIY